MAKRIEKIVVHWSASGPNMTVEQIRRHHVANNGWRNIGYHRIIVNPLTPAYDDADEWFELVKQGRNLNDDKVLEWDEIGAHTVGENSRSVGVCVIAGPTSKCHPLQVEALQKTLDTLVARFGLSRADVYGHKDFNPTQCPGPEIYGYVQNYRIHGKVTP